MKIKQLFCRHKWVTSDWFQISSWQTRYIRRCKYCGKVEIKG